MALWYVDPLVYSRCGTRTPVIVVITDRRVVDRILPHLESNRPAKYTPVRGSDWSATCLVMGGDVLEYSGEGGAAACYFATRSVSFGFHRSGSNAVRCRFGCVEIRASTSRT